MSYKKNRFELRQIDAWKNEEDYWVWNTSYHLSTFAVRDGANEKRAFLNALHRQGVVLNQGRCAVVYDGDLYEIQDRKTGEPLFAAIPCGE